MKWTIEIPTILLWVFCFLSGVGITSIFFWIRDLFKYK